jgi:hypothetical protein
MTKKLALFCTLALLLSACTSKPRTFTGVVTTTMCKDRHFTGMAAADCVRKCVKDGNPYALLVGDKLYTLDGDTAGLDAFAGATATVTGTSRGDKIHVSSVSGSKNPA